VIANGGYRIKQENDKMIDYKYIKNENNATPFHFDSCTYCAKCSRRGVWVKTEVYAANGLYIFRCHGEEEKIKCTDFKANNRIQGPCSKSFIAFNKGK